MMNGSSNQAGNQNIWLVCEATQSRLEQLGVTLERAIDVADSELRQIALTLIRRGGKRLRPALLLLVAEFGNPEDPRLLTAAASVELLHIASLYHDDVMDRAPARRGDVSVNAGWGNMLAALAGNYLFARASSLLASLGDIPNQLASQVSSDLCTGQLQEIENAYNLELSDSEHLSILNRKTATLFEFPCRLGAYLGGLSPLDSTALTVYGHNLGLAFQIIDDALDFEGEPSQMGKAIGTDLRAGIYSLPVLRALRRDLIGAQLRALLNQIELTEENILYAFRLIRESGVVAETLQVARDYARQAQTALATLPNGPARLSLRNLAEFAITRSS